MQPCIKAIIGLGNPGRKFLATRHNIGFAIIDNLVECYNGIWQDKDLFSKAEIVIDGKRIICLKPLTYMNESGKVIPFLLKNGIKPEEILIIHDDLEKKFGNISLKVGGSHRGHNGLKSIIESCGNTLTKLRFGIGRPENKYDVAHYVLERFSEPEKEVNELIIKATDTIENLIK